MPDCDRCGQSVKKSENVVELQILIPHKSPLKYLTKARHIRCSPSSAQWIIHEDFELVIDNRPKYTKDQYPSWKRQIFEDIYTEAWLELIENTKEDYSILELND